MAPRCIAGAGFIALGAACGGGQGAPVARSSSALDSCTLSSPCSIWSTAETPDGAGTTGPGTLGVQWQTSDGGYITGVTFYKVDGVATHTVVLWDASGDVLASATDTAGQESASGWQSISFASPIAVSADTTYVASFTLAAGGRYAESAFTGPVTNGPLTALATNGVYANGASPTFPQASFGQQFLVDVLFASTLDSGGDAAADDASDGGGDDASGGQDASDGGSGDAGADSGSPTCSSASPCSIWSTAETPAGAGTTSPVTLGVQWQSTEAGYVDAVTFYKDDFSSTHTVTLWDSIGDVLATATDTAGNETARGWQTVAFASPVAVSASTTYVVSFTLTEGGDYSESPFSGPVTNGPLTALATNGVYAVGSSPTFPQASFGVQFLVDVVFATDSGPGSADSGAGDASSPDAGSPDAGSPDAGSADSGPDDCTASSPCSLWATAATPAGAGYTSPVTLGLQWQANEAGYIAGVAFYKEDGAPSHTVDLWDSTGDMLASATSSSESASGWQSVSFASPVAIAANTTYVASYTMAAGGTYPESPFSGSFSNGPLTALAANGVYVNGSSPAFPQGTFGEQFLVDVLFYDQTGSSGSDAGADATVGDAASDAASDATVGDAASDAGDSDGGDL